nr:outer membrane protein porin [Tanacetum cinerariifolium]GEY52466.1 outer membrane protein porin [Tanacetum cinerariifolium]
MYMNSWDKLSLESYKAKFEKLEKENEKYIITFFSLYDNDRQYTKKIKEQEDLIDTLSDQLAEEKNTIKIKQTEISELKECLCKKDFKNEHLKSKVVDFTMVQNLQAQVKELQSKNEHLKSKVVDCQMCQNLQVQVEELKSVNESFNLSIEELYKVRAIAEATLRERDAMIFAQCEKIRLLEELSESFYEEMRDKVKCFDDEKKVFENKISKLEKDLAQRVKDFDDVKTELSRRTDKFETYFANLEKENALLKSQLASQNYTSFQKENNDLRTSYSVLKEEYEISCAKLEKENNDLKMHYKRLFDSVKQKKVAS